MARASEENETIDGILSPGFGIVASSEAGVRAWKGVIESGGK
jgi:hypothetical protein